MAVFACPHCLSDLVSHRHKNGKLQWRCLHCIRAYRMSELKKIILTIWACLHNLSKKSSVVLRMCQPYFNLTSKLSNTLGLTTTCFPASSSNGYHICVIVNDIIDVMLRSLMCKMLAQNISDANWCRGQPVVVLCRDHRPVWKES